MNIIVYIFIVLYAFKLPKRGIENELPSNPEKNKIIKTKKIKNNGYNFAKNDTNSNYTISEIIYKKMLLDKLVDVNISDLVKLEFIQNEYSIITGNNLEKGGLFKDWEIDDDFEDIE